VECGVILLFALAPDAVAALGVRWWGGVRKVVNLVVVVVAEEA